MTREQAKEYILEHATEYLKPDGSGKGYICPVCGSGGGRHGTGLQLGANKRTFTCFAGGCINGTSGGDIFDVIGAEYGLTDYNDKLMKAAELLQREQRAKRIDAARTQSPRGLLARLFGAV